MAETHWFIWLFKTTCVVIITLWLVIITVIVGPMVQTKFFPVFGKFTYVSIKETAPGISEVVVQYRKNYRCAPGGFAWYLGDRDADFDELRVEAVRMTTGEEAGRPPGLQRSQPFKVYTTEWNLRNNVFVDIYSWCGWPWKSVSEVLP